MRRRLILWIPFLLFACIAVAAAVMLKRPDLPEDKSSRFVGKALPAFDLPPALPNREGIRRADYGAGSPRILNVFASWCLPCITEAPQLMTLARQGLPIDAVAIRDRTEDVALFLSRHGDPYRKIGSDVDSSLQIAIGSRGVPETFIIDGRGTIRYQHVGPVNASDIARIRDEFEKARQ